MKISKRELARGTANKLTKQMVRSPEGRLQRAILTTAILDLLSKNSHYRKSAEMYVLSGMPTAQLAGLEPEYVRRVLREVKLLP